MYLKLKIIVLTVLLTFSHLVYSQERGSAGEAQAMVDSAISLFNDLGADVAFERFNSSESAFLDRDLYVFVIGPDNLIVSHAYDIQMVGIDTTTVKDSNGDQYGQRIVDSATEEGTWVDYIRKDPISGDDHEKTSWVKLHQNYIFGVGIYK